LPLSIADAWLTKAPPQTRHTRTTLGRFGRRGLFRQVQVDSPGIAS
jgi:hypothetical protein